jgi:hypothetical protein
MRQFIFLPSLGFSILLLTGALDRQTLFSNPSAQEAFIPRSAPFAAGRIMNEVLANFAPDRLHWLEMSVWQKMWGDDPFEASGRLLLGPQQRLRLEMDISVDGQTTRNLVISDGRAFQKSQQIDGTKIILESCPMAEEAEGSLDSASLAQRRAAFLNKRGLGGLHALLSRIGACLVNPTQQTGLWRQRRVLRVSGFWNTAEKMLQSLPQNLRARSCNLYLDPDTLWPHRIEWLGSNRPGDHQVILLEMEFSDPVINRPLSSEECARIFKID